MPIPSYWFCDVCKKNYAKTGKYQHLKTEMHKCNLQNPSPGGGRNRAYYVENRLINLIKGGNLLDDPIKDTNLPEPLTPTKYKPKKPVPKPRSRVRVPKPLPRILPPIRKKKDANSTTKKGKKTS